MRRGDKNGESTNHMTRFEIGTVITVVSAIISGVVYISRLEGRLAALESPANRINEARIAALREISDSKSEALAVVQKALEQRPETIFDDWELKSVDQVYKADSDGFLLAFTEGTGVTQSRAHFCLETAESATDIQEEIGRGSCGNGVRNRAGVREGATTPVKKGHYYRARMYSGNPRFVTVYWLPIVP